MKSFWQCRAFWMIMKLHSLDEWYCASPAYYNKIKLDESFTKKGDMATQIAITGIVGDIDGVPAIKAPTNRFPKNVDFIITNAVMLAITS